MSCIAADALSIYCEDCGRAAQGNVWQGTSSVPVVALPPGWMATALGTGEPVRIKVLCPACVERRAQVSGGPTP